jgi:hypothetical protein
MPSWMRTLALVAVTLAVWLAVAPASAAAPLCDPRAASGFAPPPTLDAPAASVDVGDSSDSCAWLVVDKDSAYNQGRGSDPWPTPSRADVTVEPDASSVSPAPAILVPLTYEPTINRPGVRDRLERPPR